MTSDAEGTRYLVEHNGKVVRLSEKAIAIKEAAPVFHVVEDIYSISDKRAWVVVATESNTEKKVAKKFEEVSVAAFLPTCLEEKKVVYERQHMVRGTLHRTRPKTERKVVERPLLPGYMFAQIPMVRLGQRADGTDILSFDHIGQSRLLNTEGVRALLGSDGVPVAIPDRIVEQLVKTQSKRTTMPTKAEQYSWVKKGGTIRIMDGAFASFNAKIERIRDNDVVDCLVEIFNRMTPIQLELAQIERIC